VPHRAWLQQGSGEVHAPCPQTCGCEWQVCQHVRALRRRRTRSTRRLLAERAMEVAGADSVIPDRSVSGRLESILEPSSEFDPSAGTNHPKPLPTGQLGDLVGNPTRIDRPIRLSLRNRKLAGTSPPQSQCQQRAQYSPLRGAWTSPSAWVTARCYNLAALEISSDSYLVTRIEIYTQDAFVFSLAERVTLASVVSRF